MGLKERRKREIRERHAQIMDAARMVLFKHGMPMASIKRIAQAAELGVGTLYSYFGSKEDIFIALQEEGLEMLAQEIRKTARDTEDPLTRLRKIARAYLTFSEAGKDYFDILNFFLSSPGTVFEPGLKQKIDEHAGQVLNILVAAIDSGRQQGVFHTTHPRRHAVILWATLHGLIQLRKMEAALLPGEDFYRLYNQAVDNFIRNLATKSKSNKP
jgi:TetR/AcrR family transcriptional regulator